MRLTLFTAVYPGVEVFLPELLASLDAQVDGDFELFVVDNGMPDTEHRFSAASFPVRVAPEHGTPTRCRRVGLELVVSEGADAVVLVDADDRMAGNRVAIVRRLLSTHDIVCNDLVLFGDRLAEPLPLLSQRLTDGQRIDAADLRNANFMGLTNTAVRAERLASALRTLPDDIIAFDWALFARLLHDGADAVFTAETATDYRQHGGNVGGIFCFGDAHIREGVAVKAHQYRLLEDRDPWYRRQARVFSALLDRLKADENFARRYYAAVNRATPKLPLWWEAIRSDEELGI